MLFLEGNKLDKEKSPLWDPKTTLKGPFLVQFGPFLGSFFSTFLENFHEFSAVSALHGFRSVEADRVNGNSFYMCIKATLKYIYGLSYLNSFAFSPHTFEFFEHDN